MATRMNVLMSVKVQVHKAVNSLYPGMLGMDDFSIEVPKDAAHGDASTNAAMILQKKLGENPKSIAEKICKELEGNSEALIIDNFELISVAGPGFINLKLNIKTWHKFLHNMLTNGADDGISNIGNGEKVNIEFVSANPTGPMHIGHARGAVFGDAIARLMKKSGYNVTREYYVNDAGSQIDTLAKSAFIRYQQVLGIEAEIPEGAYPGEYLLPVGEGLAKLHGKELLNMEETKRVELIKEFAVTSMLKLIKEDLALIKVEHDVFTSEKKDIQEKQKVREAIEFLKEKGLIYRGILEAPKGKLPDDWEPREQELFSSTKFGDDVDRPLTKSDGTNTYFSADIAYHLDKIQRGFNNIILLLGADHSGYIKRMKAAVAALSDNKANFDIKINQLVNLFKDGQPYKMSKRSGNFITVKDLVDEIGADVLRFMMLTRKNDTVFDFHLEKALEQTKDNPVFYVQYAHARANSVLRIAKEQGFTPDQDKISLLQNECDLALVKKIAEYPRIVEAACLAHEPHRITFYLIELANELHTYWAKGNDDETLRFILPHDPAMTSAKLNIVTALINTIASGLDILGVKAIEKM
jgi:arginyl-tRNA synthetase